MKTPKQKPSRLTTKPNGAPDSRLYKELANDPIMQAAIAEVRTAKIPKHLRFTLSPPNNAIFHAIAEEVSNQYKLPLRRAESAVITAIVRAAEAELKPAS